MSTDDDINIDQDERQCCTLCNPSDPVQAKNIHFHILMFFGCLYIMMVMCKWETTADANVADGRSDKIVIANLVSHWVVVVLYLVTLIAPICCPDRFVGDVEDTD